MYNSKLPSKSEYSPLASSVRQLRSSSSYQRNHASSVDNAPILLAVPSQASYSVFAAVPYALYVDILREIPDLFGTFLCIPILGMHDARVVEHDVYAAPGIKV